MDYLDDVRDDIINKICYASSNGYFDRCEKDRFLDYESIWEYGHDPDTNTTPPEIVTNESLRLYRATDADRYVFHHLQPHAPFLHAPGKYGSLRDGISKANVWSLLRKGDVGPAEVWNYYLRNLEVGLDHAETIIENVSGKVIVTSDHGNGMGEWGVYGHPDRTLAPAVKRVPWAEATGANNETYDVRPREELVEKKYEIDRADHLRDLGYFDK